MRISTLETPFVAGSTPVTPDFTIYTGAMQVDPEQDDVVHMVGSSTQRDLQGDTMSLDALTDMTKVEPGLTIFLNHIYTVPDSYFGFLLKSPGLSLQDGIADVKITTRVTKTNPPAMQTLGHINEGARFGCSIGCIILEYEIDEESDDGRGWYPPLIIHHVQTLEWSVVGIPANQRCWCEPGAKGLFERMLSTSKGDEALKLAPIVKGLYPKAYIDKIKEVGDDALRRDLERIQARPSAKQRLEWAPNEQKFMLNQRGNYTSMERNEVSAFLKKSVETSRTNSYLGLVRESTPGTVVKSAEESAIDEALALIPDSVAVDNPLTEKWLNESEALDENDTLDTKGACGKTSWPLADRDRAWSNSEAHKRIMEWAGGDEPSWSKVKTVHFWFDGEEADKWGGYKLLFCDVVDGTIKAIPKAIFACAGAVQGARGGLKIPDSDLPGVKSRIKTYYNRMASEFDDDDIKVPWEDDKEDSVELTESNSITQSIGGSTHIAFEHKEQNQESLTASVDISDQEQVPEPQNFLEASQALDLQLFNALAARFGRPQIALNSDGTIAAPVVEPSINPDFVQETIARALQFLDIVKSGNEFSSKNKKALQALHDGIVTMCKAQFHPCEELAGKKPDEEDGDEEDDGKEKHIEDLVARSIEPIQEQLGTLIEVLAKHGLDGRALKGLSTQVEVLTKKLQGIAGQAKATEERVAVLRSMPLGQPTLLRRSVQGEMGDNERTWTLAEALKGTTIVPRQVGDEIIHYRLWPEGVGGSVKDGVRPVLTGAQRSLMAPMDQVAYREGEEAAVPLYDDPGGVSM